MGIRKNVFEIYVQFRHAPTKSFANRDLGQMDQNKTIPVPSLETKGALILLQHRLLFGVEPLIYRSEYLIFHVIIIYFDVQVTVHRDKFL